MQLVIAAIIGLVGGLTSGLFGVGGGIVMVPAMMFFMNMDIKAAVGTSLVVIVPTAIAGSVKHYQLGNIHWATALSLIPATMVASYAGAWLTHVVASQSLKRAFGAFIILAGIKLLFFDKA